MNPSCNSKQTRAYFIEILTGVSSICLDAITSLQAVDLSNFILRWHRSKPIGQYFSLGLLVHFQIKLYYIIFHRIWQYFCNAHLHLSSKRTHFWHSALWLIYKRQSAQRERERENRLVPWILKLLNWRQNVKIIAISHQKLITYLILI